MRRGKTLRRRAPRDSHGEWKPAAAPHGDSSNGTSALAKQTTAKISSYLTVDRSIYFGLIGLSCHLDLWMKWIFISVLIASFCSHSLFCQVESPTTGSLDRESGPSPIIAPTEVGEPGLIEPGQDARKHTNSSPENGDIKEKFHWRGLLLESIAFDSVQNSVRIMTAGQHDRHILLNKPFWSDYGASLEQFNWRRWNDGDSIKVNYIGHPMEGAIAGYLEIQNNPNDRAIRRMNTRAYWHSRLRAFAWSAIYSTQWELGPIGESAIFNQGGFTYPIQCAPNCNPSSKYTNNTGWVDLIVTPTIGTIWLIGEDALDSLITDPLVRRHPHNFGYLVLRSGANPSRSLANMLRGRYPWYRDYEHIPPQQSRLTTRFDTALDRAPEEHLDLFLMFAAASFPSRLESGSIVPQRRTGGGAQLGIRLSRYLDVTAAASVYPDQPNLPASHQGPVLDFAFGVRSGFSGKYFSLKAGVAPGFVSTPRSIDYSNDPTTSPRSVRCSNFQWTGTLAADLKVSARLAARISLQNAVIRYKSTQQDTEGIGSPPHLYFLSHDNYVNSTNWGLELGPVFRF